MTNKKNTSPELKFPLLCHYRIVAQDIANMKFVIETVAMNLGAVGEVKIGNKSKGGKYISFMIDIHVHSKEEMDRIDQEFRNIEGVKMVL